MLTASFTHVCGLQAPVFISFFIALRKMAYLPVPSLQTGGALWFTDLTAADPFYILPLAVTGTMFFILEVRRLFRVKVGPKIFWARHVRVTSLQLGAESGVDNPNLQAMKTVMRVMPIVILPFTINFPTVSFLPACRTSQDVFVRCSSQRAFESPQAVFTYWMTSNCFSLFQVALLKNSVVRQKLRIPDKIQHPASAVPKNEGLIEGIKKGLCC